MKNTLTFACVLALLINGANIYLSQTNRRPDVRERARAEAREERREEDQEELKAATEELAALSKILTEEVVKADGYTLSLEILEATDRIEELAQQIEELARTINRRAQGR